MAVRKAKNTTRKPSVKPKAQEQEPNASGLSPQQQVFAFEYVKDWNATRAALVAGYSEKTAYSQGARLLKNVEIQNFISEFVSTHGMSAAEVLMRLADHARGSFVSFLPQDEFMVRGEAPKLNLSTEEARANLHLIKKLKTKTRTSLKEGDEWEEVEVEVTIHDAQAALEKLGRYHKLFTDRAEVTGKNGGPIQHEDVGLTDTERVERIAALAERARARRA